MFKLELFGKRGRTRRVYLANGIRLAAANIRSTRVGDELIRSATEHGVFDTYSLSVIGGDVLRSFSRKFLSFSSRYLVRTVLTFLNTR